MTDVLNVALDDIVKRDREERRKQRRDSGRDKIHSENKRFEPYVRDRRHSDGTWKHDKFEAYDQQIQFNRENRFDGQARGYKVKVMGISEGVTVTELKELFSAVGITKHVRSHRYNNSASIIFKTKQSAYDAVELFNGKSLDDSNSVIQVEYIGPLEVSKVVQSSAPDHKNGSRVIRSNQKDDVRSITVKVL